MEHAVELFGSFDENVRLLEKEYNVVIICRGTQVKVTGEPEDVASAVRAVQGLLSLIEQGEQLTDQNVRYVMTLVKEGREEKIREFSGDCICITAKGRPIKAKTLAQKAYVDTIRSSTITIAVGPAGTGKTYLAVAMAVRAFRGQEVNRIILTRPAVEAG
ncbi:MAG TPA: PhoH family protein, partial [Oscillospiraceae bacterium]|nr:PhoH family protein [Oscillospiraceae bacterium]